MGKNYDIFAHFISPLPPKLSHVSPPLLDVPIIVLMQQYLLNRLILGAVPLIRAAFGQGTGDIVMDDVACRGDESSLVSCQHTSQHDCVHSEDAGVRCQQG